ncbi:unnamed protein product, partial [Brassica rapa subsp. trilocularis]
CVCVLGPNLAFRSRLRHNLMGANLTKISKIQMNHADKPKTQAGVQVRP